MKLQILSAALGLALVGASVSWGQGTSAARVETAPLELTAPDHYQIPVVLEPSRRVVVVAPADGILRSWAVPVGATVRELAEIGQLDRAEASAHLKIAEAVVKEMQAALDEAKAGNTKSKPQIAQAEARLEAAKARAELEQLALDRCTLHAPFAGRLFSLKVSTGQYLSKGAELAELADVSSLRACVPIDRTAVSVGADISLEVEGKAATGKVQAVLPLSETFARLRELAAPLAAAWVSVANSSGALEPGQRVLSPFLPAGALATVPTRAVHGDPDAASGSGVQVIRSEFVTDVPVRVLGNTGAESTQVSGPFRPNDVLIVSSSVPLVSGTLIRFGNGASSAVEAQGPKPGEVGEIAGITPPARSQGVAPIGAPGSAVPKAQPRQTPRQPATKPATRSQPAAGTVPF